MGIDGSSNPNIRPGHAPAPKTVDWSYFGPKSNNNARLSYVTFSAALNVSEQMGPFKMARDASWNRLRAKLASVAPR